jgi:hypothetical protein
MVLVKHQNSGILSSQCHVSAFLCDSIRFVYLRINVKITHNVYFNIE